MELNTERRPELQTGQMRRVTKAQVDRLSGLEILDLSDATPATTAHLKLGQQRGGGFQKKNKVTPYGNAWQLSDDDRGLQLELRLPFKHGVVLILEMCRTTYDPASKQPVIIAVNGEEWPLELDPHNLKYYKQSQYLPHYLMRQGKNIISLRLVPESPTTVFIKSAAVMRFDLEKQKRGNWCWASVTNSLLSFFNQDNELTQCDIVKECFGLTRGYETEIDCCQHSRSNECNRTYKLVDALDLMGLSFMRCNYPLSTDEIREQINQGVPIAVRIGWRGGGGHFVVITAIGPTNPVSEGCTWLRIADPKDQAASYITYRSLKNRYKGEGKWTHSYLFERERIRRS